MAAQPRAAQHLDQLFDLAEIVFDPNQPFEQRLEAALATESDHLDVPCGFLTNIDVEADRQEITLTSGMAGNLREAETAPLSESYCRKTIASDSGTLTVADARAEGWDDDPAYRRFELETYVGSTVEFAGQPRGTLCFADDTPRDEPFGETPVAFVELLARWASYELAHRTGREPAEPVGDRLASFREGVEPSVVDTALDLLANRTRRDLLSYLATADGPITVEEAAAHLANTGGVHGQSPGRLEIALVHSHVPKLADAGVVTYDAPTGELDYRPDDAIERVRRRVRPLED
jgi:hypothetical protein